jgi:hypothetical protein
LNIGEYQKQRKYRAKRKSLKNAKISDKNIQEGRNFDVNDLTNVRKDLRKER